MEAAVLAALGSVHKNNPGGHHFGAPYLTAYQLAIKVDAAAPQIAQALGVTVGGAGTGSNTSLAQYLARELSGRIKTDPDHYPVQGAFVSNEHVTAVHYQDTSGNAVTSSLTGTGFDLSLFRKRTRAAPVVELVQPRADGGWAAICSGLTRRLQQQGGLPGPPVPFRPIREAGAGSGRLS